ETRHFGQHLLPTLDDLAASLVGQRTSSLQQELRRHLTSSHAPSSPPMIPLGLRNRGILLPDGLCWQGEGTSCLFLLTRMACKSSGCRRVARPLCWSIPPHRISIRLGHGSPFPDAWHC